MSPPPAPGAPPPPPMGRAALSVGLASLVGRASGFVRDAVFSATFGAGAAADAYYAATRVPNLLRELLAEGTLTHVAVPLLTEAQEKEGPDALWRLANALLGVLLLLLGGITLLFLVFARPFLLLVASGFGEDPDKLALGTWLVRLLSPFLAGLSVASLLAAMGNVRGRFFVPALAPSLLNGAVIVACLFAPWWSARTGTEAIGAVAVATTLSGLLTAAVQLPALWRDGYRIRPALRHPALGRALRFGSAALLGIGAVQFNLLVETQLASRWGDGPVSWLTLGFRLVQLPLSVFAGSVAISTLSTVSAKVARGEPAAADFSRGLGLTSFLVAPTAVGLGLLADPLVRLCFERGAFSPADTLATAEVLRMYALATLGICLHRVMVPLCFAVGDPYLPMRASVAAMVAKLPVALALTDALGLGVAGLPLSHAILVTAEVAWIGLGLRLRLGGLPGLLGEHARIGASALAMAAVILLLRPWAEAAHGLGALGVGGVGSAVFLASAVVLRVPSAEVFRERVLRRLLPPPPPGRRPPP